MSKVFESGHFKKHNDEVKARLKANPNAKAAFKDYATQVVADAQALVDAGASRDQMKDSGQALIDASDEAFDLIVHGTSHGK